MNEAAQRTVELAIAAAGVRDNDWIKRVYDNIGEIAVMMKDESEVYEWARRITEAAVFKVNYLGYEEETPEGWSRPSRLLIHTQSDRAIKNAPGKPGHNPTGEEHVRTDPLWTRPGKLVANRIKQVQVGSELLIYKFTEEVDGERKVRVLVHFQVLRTPRPGVSDPPGRAQERRTVEPPRTAPSDQAPVETAAPPEPHSPADNRALLDIEARFMKLSGPDKVAYAQAVKEFGITNPICPEPEQMQDALNILDGLEKG